MLLHVSFPDVLFCFLPLGWLKEEYKDGTQTRLLFLVTCECCTVGKAHPAIVGPASSHSLSFRYRLFLRVATDLQCLKIPPCSKSRHRNIYEGNNPSPPIHVQASPRKSWVRSPATSYSCSLHWQTTLLFWYTLWVTFGQILLERNATKVFLFWWK